MIDNQLFKFTIKIFSTHNHRTKAPPSIPEKKHSIPKFLPPHPKKPWVDSLFPILFVLPLRPYE